MEQRKADVERVEYRQNVLLKCANFAAPCRSSFYCLFNSCSIDLSPPPPLLLYFPSTAGARLVQGVTGMYA